MLFQQEKWGHIWNSWLNRYFPPCVVLDIYSPTQLIVSRIGAQNVYCVQLNPQQLYYKFQGDRGVRRKGTLKWVSGSLELTSIQLGENSGSLPNLWKLIFCRNASASNLGQNMVNRPKVAYCPTNKLGIYVMLAGSAAVFRRIQSVA